MIELDTVRRMALALPETLEKPHFRLTGFRVRDKLFAAVTEDGTQAHVHVGPTDVERELLDNPTGMEELRRGDILLGLTVDLTAIRPDHLERLLRDAWCNRAPRKLARTLDGSADPGH